jgi:hypothetical protein
MRVILAALLCAVAIPCAQAKTTAQHPAPGKCSLEVGPGLYTVIRECTYYNPQPPKAKRAPKKKAVTKKVRHAAVPLPRPRPVIDDTPQEAPDPVAGGFNVLRDYVASLLKPAPRCWEWQKVDPRVRTVAADAGRHFGGTVLMTSCYRSAAYNAEVYRRMGRRVTRSQHIRHKALDIKIAGVSGARLASYVRPHPLLWRIGGVGRYRGDMVHIDSGPKRNWCWGCGERRHASNRKRRQFI